MATMTMDDTGLVVIESCSVDNEGDRITLRGVMTSDSLPYVQYDDYQREELTERQRLSILQAIESGEPLPDLELALRDESFEEVKRGRVIVRGTLYVIDGKQRTGTILRYVADNPGTRVRIGVKIYINTTKEWERKRFHILNAKRTKVSPNVLLRNMRDDSDVLQMLWGLTHNEKSFVMHNKVCWEHNMAHGELVTALTFAKVVTTLHAHKGPSSRHNLDDLVDTFEKTVGATGIQAMRDNIRTFWNLIDECWNIKRVHRKGSVAFLKGNFLSVLARILSDHHDFWETDEKERKLFIHAPLRRKLAGFKINDSEILRLAGSGGKSSEILYILMRDHLNAGKRTKRLRSRYGNAGMLDISEEENGEAGAEE